MKLKQVLGKSLEDLMKENKLDELRGFDFNNEIDIDHLYYLRLKMLEMFLEGYEKQHK